VTSYYGQQVEMDNQARVLLPQILRNAAQLDGEVTVCGMRTYLEVHNREIFEQDLEANQLTGDVRKTLAEIFRRKG
jgi:MraZ protein